MADEEYSNDQPPEHMQYDNPEDPIVTKLAFMNLLGNTVLKEVLSLSKTDADIELLYVKWSAATHIDLSLAETIQGVNYIAGREDITLDAAAANRVLHGVPA